MKVVINGCFGGYSLSPAGIAAYAKRKGRPCHFFVGGMREPYRKVSQKEATAAFIFFPFDTIEVPAEMSNEWYREHHIDAEDRADPDLVAVVESLGKKANGSCASLEVVEIPDGVDYTIEEYDGSEHIAEKHRTWR